MPATVVTVPEVPSRCAAPRRMRSRKRVLALERLEQPHDMVDHRLEGVAR